MKNLIEFIVCVFLVLTSSHSSSSSALPSPFSFIPFNFTSFFPPGNCSMRPVCCRNLTLQSADSLRPCPWTVPPQNQLQQSPSYKLQQQELEKMCNFRIATDNLPGGVTDDAYPKAPINVEMTYYHSADNGTQLNSRHCSPTINVSWHAPQDQESLQRLKGFLIYIEFKTNKSVDGRATIRRHITLNTNSTSLISSTRYWFDCVLVDYANYAPGEDHNLTIHTLPHNKDWTNHVTAYIRPRLDNSFVDPPVPPLKNSPKFDPSVVVIPSPLDGTVDIWFTPASYSPCGYRNYNVYLFYLEARKWEGKWVEVGQIHTTTLDIRSIYHVKFTNVCPDSYRVEIWPLYVDDCPYPHSDGNFRFWKNDVCGMLPDSHKICLETIINMTASPANSTCFIPSPFPPTVKPASLNLCYPRAKATPHAPPPFVSSSFSPFAHFFHSTSEPQTEKVSVPTDKVKELLIIIPVTLSVVLVLLVVLVVLLRRHRKGSGFLQIFLRSSSVTTWVLKDPPPRVLLVYADDHPLHREVVMRFASFLQNCCHVDVRYDAWAELDISRISPISWLTEQLQQCNDIIIINSEGGSRRFQAWSTHHRDVYVKRRPVDDTPLPDLFVTALADIQQEIKNTAKTKNRSYDRLGGENSVSYINNKEFYRLEEGVKLAQAIAAATEYFKTEKDWFNQIYIAEMENDNHLVHSLDSVSTREARQEGKQWKEEVNGKRQLNGKYGGKHVTSGEVIHHNEYNPSFLEEICDDGRLDTGLGSDCSGDSIPSDQQPNQSLPDQQTNLSGNSQINATSHQFPQNHMMPIIPMQPNKRSSRPLHVAAATFPANSTNYDIHPLPSNRRIQRAGAESPPRLNFIPPRDFEPGSSDSELYFKEFHLPDGLEQDSIEQPHAAPNSVTSDESLHKNYKPGFAADEDYAANHFWSQSQGDSLRNLHPLRDVSPCNFVEHSGFDSLGSDKFCVPVGGGPVGSQSDVLGEDWDRGMFSGYIPPEEDNSSIGTEIFEKEMAKFNRGSNSDIDVNDDDDKLLC